MKLLKYFSCIALGCFFALPASAQIVLPQIRSGIGDTAAKIIENSETAFCYQVTPKSPTYAGYTLNNMAITGFCGIIDNNLRQMLLNQLVSEEKNIDFLTTENCTIQPRVLLRFVRGVDNVDILLSSPCYSISIFYGGSVRTYNMKPAAQLLTTVTDAFKKTQTKFVSPAVLNQLLPIGVVQSAEQRSKLLPVAQPKKSWSSDNSQSRPQNNWNTLNFSK